MFLIIVTNNAFVFPFRPLSYSSSTILLIIFNLSTSLLTKIPLSLTLFNDVFNEFPTRITPLLKSPILCFITFQSK